MGLTCSAIVIVGIAAAYFDPGKLPADCSTLSGLTRKAAPLNFGLLVQMGARHSEADVWNNLLELLSIYPLPKSEITRDTVFLQSQLKKRNAARSRVGV